MSSNTNPRDYLSETAQESSLARELFLETHRDALLMAAETVGRCVKNGGKILIFGNGGSAADAQHMAAEMVGRMLVERNPLAAIALSTDTSIITAIANDYSYDLIFSKQVEALARKDDVLVAISTSGNSKNVLKAVEAARARGCKVISLTGGSGGELAKLSDISLNVEGGKNSSRVQETHLFIEHSIVDLADRFYA